MPSSGSAELGELLSRAAKGIQSQAVAVGSELRMNEAAAQGQKDGFAGKPKPVSGIAALTPWGKGYNSAAEAAYSAKVQTDIANTVDTLALEHEADPEGMKAAIDAVAVQMYDGVPEQYRPWVGAMLKGKTAVAVGRAKQQLKIRTENETLAAALEGSVSAASAAIEAGVNIPGKEGDDLVIGYVTENRRRLEVMAKEGLIKPTDVAKYDSDFRAAVDKGISDTKIAQVSEHINAITREDADAGAAAMQTVWDNPNLTDEQKAAVEKNWEEANNAEHYKNARLYADQLANVSQRIAAGETGRKLEADLATLRKRNVLTPVGFADKMAAVVRNAKESAAKQEKLSAWEIVQAEGGVMDPGNGEHKKAIDEVFKAQAAVSGYTVGSPEWKMLAIDTLRKSNIFPESARAFVRTTSASANPEAAALAASFYAEAKRANPRAFIQGAFDPKLDSYLLQLDRAVSAGGEPAVVAEKVNNQVFEQTPEMQERLRAEYTKQNAFKRNPLALAEHMRGSQFETEGLIFDSTLPPTREMMADFDNAVKLEFMRNGGELEAAQSKAAEDILGKYRKTDVNGKDELMAWAPQLPTSILHADIAATVKDAGYDVDKLRVRLEPTDETDSSMGLRWGLIGIDEDGMSLGWLLDKKTGKPIRYQLPGADAYDKALEQVKADKLAEAQRIRENEQTVKQATDQLFSNPNPRMLQ
jgi:hypothetical protein